MEIQRNATEIKQTCASCDELTLQNAGSGDLPIHPLLNQSNEVKENYVRKSTLEKCSGSRQFVSKYTQAPDLGQADSKEELRIQNNFKVNENVEDSGFSEKVRISCRGLEVEIDFQTCDSIYVNDIGTVQLNYSFRITSQEDYQFCIRNSKTNEETSYKKIIGEGSFLLDFPSVVSAPKNHTETNCQEERTEDQKEEVRPISIHEDALDSVQASASSSKEELTSDFSETKFSRDSSCETIEITLNSDETSVNCGVELRETEVDLRGTEIFNSKSSRKVCSNCSQIIEDETIYLCLFGHDSCWECKGKPCILCRTMMGESKSYCKNHHKGCTYLETPENLIKHETDCELNSFRCPMPKCVFLNTLSDLKLHFLNCHTKSLIQTNSVMEVLYGRKDRKWYLYCHESLFVCSYYYYGSHIEFILQYIGANDKAKSYMLEVEIKTMKEKKLKRVRCAGWNEVSLCKGVCYDCEDLTNCDNSRFQFTANLKVVNLSNGGLYPTL